MSFFQSLRTSLSLSVAYLRERPLATALNVLLLALGLATIIALMLTLHQAEKRLERDSAGIDLVVGAKGSPLQLVLSSVFHIDVPTGNIPMTEAALIAAEPAVKRAIPLALGDSYKGYRIVGTNPEYAALYEGRIAQGAFWQKPMQAVLGAEVAASTGLRVSGKFVGSHGLGDGGGGHDEHPFDVVGVLAPTGTVLDRLILTSVTSVWAVHDHGPKPPTAAQPKGRDSHDHKDDHKNDPKHDHKHDHAHDHDADSAEGKEITAYLIQYASPLAAVSFPRMVNATSSMQAAAPAMEAARLFALLGIGVNALKLFALVMVICATLGIFVGLMSALHERRDDLVLLRVLGASPSTVVLTVVCQGLWLGIGGVILGLALGHGGAIWIAQAMSETQRIPLGTTAFLWQELWVAAGALGLAVLAAAFPAWRAYRSTAALTLRGA